jgi:hypothetical protein
LESQEPPSVQQENLSNDLIIWKTHVEAALVVIANLLSLLLVVTKEVHPPNYPFLLGSKLGE